MLNLLRRFTHRLGISPLMMSARRTARAQNARLTFGRDAITWERDQWVLLLSPDPYTIHFTLSYVDDIVRTAIPEQRTGKLWVDAREATRYQCLTGRDYWSIMPPERVNTLKGYLARGAPGPGDVVLDVGAYIGEISIEMSKLVGPTGCVYALEPDAENLRLLRRNLAHHNITNVIPQPWGLWNTSETASFVNGRHCASMLQAGVPSGISITNSINIQTFSPEDMIRKIGAAPTFIKMDIEGIEVDVMPALADYYATKSLPVRLAIASYHVRDGRRTSETITPILQQAGFTVETGYPEHQTTWAWRN